MGYLRTLLAITVIFAHSPYGTMFVGGRLAVQIFYVMSGFLIAHVLRTNPTYANPVKFYINRSLRIYPIYYIVAAMALIYVTAIDRSVLDLYYRIPFVAKLMLIISNLTVLGQDWVMFSGVVNGELRFVSSFKDSDVPLWKGLLIPQAWTLGVELTFYAMAPFVLRYAHLTFLLLLLSCFIRYLTIKSGVGLNDPWTYRFFPSELALFLLGALSNRYLLPYWQKAILNRRLVRLPQIASAILIACCIFFAKIPMNVPIKNVILVGLCVTLLPLTFIFQQISKNDKVVGELSYPIYIVHTLVIAITASLLSMLNLKLDSLVQTMISIFASCLLAYGLNKMVSRPVEYIRTRIRSSGKTS